MRGLGKNHVTEPKSVMDRPLVYYILLFLITELSIFNRMSELKLKFVAQNSGIYKVRLKGWLSH